jgi:sulfofructose kinase
LSSASAGGGARAILCAGIIVLDEVFRVDRFPQPDAKTQAQSFFIVNGGCAANAAVAIARLGGRAALAGPLGGPPGEDSNGDRVLAALAREEIDCTGCQRLAGVVTALSAIFIDARGERMIVTHHDDRLATATPADPARLVACADPADAGVR